MSESIIVDVAPSTGEPITETQEVTQEVQTEETSQSESEIPAKYAGKSMAEVIKMQQEAESLMSRQADELGQQRKLMQSLIDAQNKATETIPPEEPVAQEDNFFDDPVNAVNKAIENHPDVIKAREERMGNVQKHNLDSLDKAYPDWQDTVKDSSFQKFIGDSATRTEMFRKADTEYRSDLAIELFDWYSQTKMSGATQEAVAKEKSNIEKAMKQTSSETRSSGDSVGGKKVYRRADLINLQVTDPNRYASLADEIQSAYAEGRVK
tara:strand:- start:70 stop:867 length:798 start_codon:yes stop_codon:yes gene_type:complete